MDNQYWALGSQIGTGFDAGKKLLLPNREGE